MLARIKFVTHDSKVNIISNAQLKELVDFLGENIETSKLKINEHGKPETLDWRDTFDEEYAKQNENYKVVTPSDYVKINDSNNYIVELERFTSTFPHLEFTIKGVPKSVGTDYTEMLSMMNMVADKIDEAKNRFDKVVEYNQKCDVRVPGLGLLNLNRLAFATDYCTEELQRLLHQGWRIVAVCPQPDQRRPDYILGMNVSSIGDNVEVEHFSGYGREGRLKDRDREKSFA